MNIITIILILILCIFIMGAVIVLFVSVGMLVREMRKNIKASFDEIEKYKNIIDEQIKNDPDYWVKLKAGFNG